ncbi:5-deoxy-glucuronate isomerase [Paenibacillus guangzhouensis]|uniref:5-deoxy-glucuronate isomerase n=1 Tax=Paenibacillus guangzhouensis TaxID=1473112 RepID=UPI001266BBED|nr:5-deoxy-glucuronate isomerase [Paenibacillus guangzhouensis]
MPNLLQRGSQPNASGNTLTITPQSAGWQYVGFQVYQLSAEQTLSQETGENEICIVVLSGIANVLTREQQYHRIGRRMSVFEQIPPYAVYVPASDLVQFEALTELVIAICSAPAEGRLPARLITPDQIGVEARGNGTTARTIHNILPEQEEAERLLVVEVFTPAGHWSSYPPHKHDQDRLPYESQLEETYYYNIAPVDGFAIQRVYTDDLSLNETLVVHDGDAVLVPRGYHPVAAPPGYDVYYLNVMAGPVRTWRFHNDPKHAWLMKPSKEVPTNASNIIPE